MPSIAGMAGRFVAIGDSFTEGVGDWDVRFPDGVRGWADRVAKQLSKADPEWEYADLAIRSKRLAQIVDEQIGPALAWEPTLVSFYAGGNDLLELRGHGCPAGALRGGGRRLCASGAQVLLFTGFDVPLGPMLERIRRRNHVFNAEVRRLAAEHGATLVDYWAWGAYRDRRMWDTDRLHMNRAGHRYMAIRVLDLLGVRHRLAFEPFGPAERHAGPGAAALREAEWLRQWVLSMFGRRMRGITLGDALSPRWPEPVRPSEGLKKLYRRGCPPDLRVDEP